MCIKIIEDKEILDIGDGCKLEFTRDGKLKIGKDCEGKILNPGEIQLLDRVNQENEAT